MFIALTLKPQLSKLINKQSHILSMEEIFIYDELGHL